MPEGDTIHRAARALHAHLAGKTVLGFRSNKILTRDLPGRRVEAVEAFGKHLVVRFDDGRAIHSHMQMTGAWHLYRPGERWRKSPGAARVVLEVGPPSGPVEVVAVCFAAPIVELVVAGPDRTPDVVAHLGPDLLSPDFDVDEAVRRLRARGAMPIGVAVMDQTALAGIGNVYKSEVLFVTGVDPFELVDALDDATLSTIVKTARRLLWSNLRGGPMRTTRRGDGPKLWVYRRSGLPCLKCGTTLRMERQGEQARSTYWCPRCQAPREVRGPRSEV
jgi:endonuclease-8